MTGRHQQPHRRRHLLALIDRKGSPSRTPLLLSPVHLSVPLARAGLHFCPRRNFIRSRRERETEGSERVRYDAARK